jgi:hypothetical protein
MIVVLMLQRRKAAIDQPRTGEIIQLAIICIIFAQLITSIQRAMIQAPTSQPITE